MRLGAPATRRRAGDPWRVPVSHEANHHERRCDGGAANAATSRDVGDDGARTVALQHTDCILAKLVQAREPRRVTELHGAATRNAFSAPLRGAHRAPRARRRRATGELHEPWPEAWLETKEALREAHRLVRASPSARRCVMLWCTLGQKRNCLRRLPRGPCARVLPGGHAVPVRVSARSR